MRRVLVVHNFFRRYAAHHYNVANMNMLSWSESLAARAEEKIKCSSWRTKRKNRLGVNSNVDRFRNSGSLPLDRLLTRWFSQRNFFTSSSSFQGCSPWFNCLQFRTMMNAKQRSLGCALLHDCGRRRNYSVLLCYYEGGGSNEAELEFGLGSVCSKCGNSLAFCQDGLCASCPHSDRHLCDCRKTCNREGVGQGHLNSTSCTCTCEYGLGPNCDEPCRNPQHVLDFDMCRRVANVETHATQDPILGPIAPFDCERLGHLCPEQCLCTPWPGTSNSGGRDQGVMGEDLVDPEGDVSIHYYSVDEEYVPDPSVI